MVNWEMVSALKRNESLVILDLVTHNQALLTKWLWKLDKEPGELWKQTMATVYGIHASGEIGSDPTHSYFLKSITELLPFYKVENTTLWKIKVPTKIKNFLW